VGYRLDFELEIRPAEELLLLYTVWPGKKSTKPIIPFQIRQAIDCNVTVRCVLAAFVAAGKRRVLRGFRFL
jgi:hypothetical protein